LGEAFTYIQKKQVVTRKEMLGHFNSFVTNIVLSPREEGKCKGTPQGNPASHGELFYMQKLTGKKLRLRWRNPSLAPVRQSIRKVKAVKAIKTPVTEKTAVNA
jgi:hypothetical protein